MEDWTKDYFETLSRVSSANAGAAVTIAVIPVTFMIIFGISALTRLG